MGSFNFGELVLLIDSKDRRYLLSLKEGDEFHTHSGYIRHSAIVEMEEGSHIKASSGKPYLVVRPTMSDVILKMPRSAQIIYPKDIGHILLVADIYPGVKVLESGVGSGALSTAMLRAGANITGYELREDFATRANKNVCTFFGEDSLNNYTIHIRDVYEGIDEDGYDRVVLDLPEPWKVVPHLSKAMELGGIVVAYTPSITQAMKMRDALNPDNFVMQDTFEVSVRSWHIEGKAVRPEHRMVAHTGFITHARFVKGNLN
ncbi:MAG: tRNA (adenine-N1)-methyltransferase [Acidimicrobiaceae bacterium]|nr:tRNA (adenine-N1)-methyltransferase [Acidimicrobiaceae bacterium]|tara:strand:+ start:1008 stop:1787 length:780 start_codon:yes stop_codon:yes gene_type:complete